VRVGLGSDLLGPIQSNRGMELTLRSELTTPLEALRSATSVNDDIIGRGHDLGMIAPGYIADLVLWESNPLDQPRLFNNPSAIRTVIGDGTDTTLGSHA
ncbi:MAG: amidohydrolase family protein, partial [Microthrixaceae bacterium]